MVVLNSNKHIQGVDWLIFFSAYVFLLMMTLIRIKMQSHMIYHLSFFCIILFACLYALLVRKRITFDQDHITLEEFIFSYRIKGKQGKVKQIQEWYLRDIHQGKYQDIELNIVFVNGGKIVIKDSSYDDFHELRQYLNFSDFYRSKMSSHKL